MTRKSLRSKVIRLAHAKPELRKHLLPLVTKTAARFHDEKHEEIYYSLLNGDELLYPPAGGEMDDGDYDRRSDSYSFTIYFAVESSSYYQEALNEYKNDKLNRSYSSFRNNFTNFATVKRGTAREVKQLLERNYLDGYEVVKVDHIDIYDSQGYGDCIVYIR